MILSLIVAIADNGVIGRTGTTLPWRQKADLAHFRETTMNHPIIMGSKTFDSIGKALAGRLNIVLSRDENFAPEGCMVARSPAEAILLAENSGADEAFVCGGATIYQQSLPYISKIYLTEIHGQPKGDVLFTLPRDKWREVSRLNYAADDANDFDYSFVVLEPAQD